MSELEQDRLNRIAESHDYTNGLNGHFTKYRIDKLKKEFSKHEPCCLGSKTVLEVGAGEGRITEYLMTRFCKVVALEPAEKYFRVLDVKFNRSEIIKNVFCRQTLLENFDENNEESFDFIIVTGVLEHVVHPILFLDKIRRFLKKKGVLFLTVPNAESLHRRLGAELGIIKCLEDLTELDLKVGHRRYYTTESLAEVLFVCGFNSVTIKGIFLKPFSFPQLRVLDWLESKRELMGKKINEVSLYDALYELGNKLPAKDCAELFVVATIEKEEAWTKS